MKIAYLIHDFRRYEGQGRYTVEIASRMSRKHEVHVFANCIEQYEDCAGIRFHQVPSWRGNAMTTLLTFAASASFLPREKFNLIHAQGFCTFGGDLLTAHICNRAWHRALEKSAGGLTRKQKVYDQITKTLEETVYRSRKLRRVIAVSQRIAKDLRSDYSCTAPIDVIPHGVDLTNFHPRNRTGLREAVRAELGLPENRFAFLFVGDLRKGAAFCLEALATVPGAHLVLVSRSDFNGFRVQAEKLGIASRVSCVQATQRVERYYAAADGFLLPTPYDAFAMVVTEAMAAGLPVVVSREAGASELIEHGANGLVLERHSDLAALGEAMATLAANRDLCARMGANARLTVESYSWDSVAQKTLSVYELAAN